LLESIERITKNSSAPTLIYVTHHIEEILPVFTNTLLLKEGQVFAEGKTSELISSEKLTDFFNLPVHVEWKFNRPSLSRIQIEEKDRLKAY
jgi:iron complex transport system ATP-binding protein